MRRHSFSLVCALVLASVVATSAGAHSTPQIRAQKAHERAVIAQVDRIGKNLEGVVQAYDGAQLELQRVKASLRSNTHKLHIARRNFRAAQKRLMQRIYADYVYGKPSSIEVLAGAKSITGLINRAESVQAISNQDSALGRQALHFEHAVQRRQHELTTLKQQRASAVQRLSSRKQEIQGALHQQKRLLASIGKTIHTLQVQEAQREARLAAAAEARARRIAEEEAAARAQESDSTGSGLVGSPVGSPIPVPGSTGPGHPEAAQIALHYLGVPYVWGGSTPSGFDCSGLVMYVYAQLGISLPHFAASQYADTEPIPTSELAPGDLVFFVGSDGSVSAPGHVGIYIGGGQFVDAPYTGSVVRIDSLAGFGGFVGARRVP